MVKNGITEKKFGFTVGSYKSVLERPIYHYWQYYTFLKNVLIFWKTCFKVKVLKRFKISSNCHIKICRSLKRKAISKIPSTIFLEEPKVKETWNFNWLWKNIEKIRSNQDFILKNFLRWIKFFLVSIVESAKPNKDYLTLSHVKSNHNGNQALWLFLLCTWIGPHFKKLILILSGRPLINI